MSMSLAALRNIYDLQSPVKTPDPDPNAFKEWITLVPLSVSGISVLVLAIRGLFGLRPRLDASNRTLFAAGSITKDKKISMFRVLRALTCLLLLSFYYNSNPTDAPFNIIDKAMPLTFTYAIILSLVSLTNAARVITSHLNAILLASFGVYFYRDVIPLAYSPSHPPDASEGWVLWAKISVLGFAAIVIPLLVPRRHIPIDPSEPETQEQTASILALSLYSFLDTVVFLAYRIPHLSRDMLPSLAQDDTSEDLKARYFPLLDFQRQHIIWGLLRCFQAEFAQMSLLLVLRVACEFAAPLSFNRLLSYIEAKDIKPSIRPWVWILMLFMGRTAACIATQYHEYIGTRVAVRVEAIITQLVFEHSLRIKAKAETTSMSSDSTPPTSGTGSNLAGKLTNIVSTDLRNIVDARQFTFLLVYFPVQFVLCLTFLYAVLGWSALVGIMAMILMFPVTRNFGNRIQEIQQALMERTDARVQEVVEAMGLIRMIKLLAYESKIEEELRLKRAEELRWLFKRKVTEIANNCFMFSMPCLSMVVTYGTYGAKIFSSMAVFELFRMQQFLLTTTFPKIVTGKVSLDRVQSFLQNTELLDKFSPAQFSATSKPSHSEDIGFHAMSFAWSENSSLAEGTFRLQPGNLSFKKGSLNVLLGPTGSGKTCMLMALLGEMHSTPLTRESWFNLPRLAGVAYAAQEPWIKNDTIKANIIFGEVFDVNRYERVLHQCCLEIDLAMFEAGDSTEIGPLGINLSGGQRARISLARALYSSAKILLLDDPLAALDVHTSKWIAEKCLGGDLIRERTVLLVTHNAPLISSIAQFAVYIEEGRVKSQGPFSQVIGMNPALSRQADEEGGKLEEKNWKETMLAESEKPKVDGKLILAEEIEVGRVRWIIFWRYLRSLAGNHPWLFFTLIFAGIILTELFLNLQMWYLGHWAAQYERCSSSEVTVSGYLSIYSSIILLAIVIYFLTNALYYSGVVEASKNMQREFLHSVFGTTFRWLDVTPTSRVITRCTSDTREVDNSLPSTLLTFADVASKLPIKLAAIALFAPIFVGPGILVAALAGWLSRIFLMAQRSVKREMSNAVAPVLGHFSATTSGLVSIRAYAVEDASIEESLTLINAYTRTGIIFNNLSRWIAVRLDFLGSVFTTALAAYLVYFHKISSTNAGFALTLAVNLNGFILYAISLLNDLQTQGNSLERIHQYLKIEQEPKPTVAGIPPAFWPANGSLIVENLTSKYHRDGPEVLHGLSFAIQAGERVGIVGRTGSGKSSLSLSLLRAIITEGKVYYDGLLISSLNLDALRSKITLIPQNPELLSGTLRRNLDPFSQHEDADLHSVLRAAGLFSLQNEEEEGGDSVKLSLESQVSAGGSNLSVGQRQIVALARALLRDSKLLILDEATSAIDHRTDAIIQTSLRHELPRDVTVLIIAHRLSTIMDADRIMVLEAGHIVEFDTPKKLLEKDGGHFRSLVDGSNDRDELYRTVSGGSA